MSKTDNTFTVGEALPRIASISAHEGLHVTVTWSDGPRAGRTETIDLTPTVLRYKLYAPLRGDPDLFRSIHLADDGFAVAWGRDDGIDMASTTIEEMAAQTMTPADFVSFVKRHGYTLDSVAAELGISRRQAAYYQAEKVVPRVVALACAYLDRAKPARLVTTSDTRIVILDAISHHYIQKANVASIADFTYKPKHEPEVENSRRWTSTKGMGHERER